MTCVPRVLFFLATSASLAVAQDEIPLRLLPQVAHDAQVRELDGGVVEVLTTGADPYVLTDKVAERFDHSRLCVVSFEYTCSEALAYFEVYFGPPWHNHVSEPIEAAAEWRAHAAILSALPKDVWNDSISEFRIDFGNAEGRVVLVRNLRIRPMTPEEAAAELERAAEERRRLETLQQKVEATLISPARMADTSSAIAATISLDDASGATRIAVVGRDLDLAYQVREFAEKVPPRVPLPPAMVVGEGAAKENHTLVRVLSRYGIPEVQFLAYPPSVRGGVQVAVGHGADGKVVIVTAPLAAAAKELRIFSRYGSRVGGVRLPEGMKPPVRIAVGDFAPDAPGDEVALVGAAAQGRECLVAIVGLDGRLRADIPVPAETLGGGARHIATQPVDGSADRILLHAEGSAGFVVVDPVSRSVAMHDVGLPANSAGVFASAFADRPFAACIREPEQSHIVRLSASGDAEELDVGERENRFWFTTAGDFAGLPEGRYTKHASFAHLRTDFASPVVTDPDFSRTDADYWAGPAYRQTAQSQLAGYDTDPPTCWEPCFTHRWFSGLATRWAEAKDAETGLPSYVLLDRENKTGYYGEFGQTNAFVSGSYAPGLTPVESLYTYPQRVFLQELATRFRGNPEHFVAVEPNHEMEINAESQDTHGDYNPAMIRGFCRYLLSLYGDTDGINAVFGTPWTPERFDAPRNLGRGEWDGYSVDNPYYMTWMRFLNYVIYRVVAGTYREALLAGFPPEAIKCHQIPDHYAIASLSAFSRPAQRITPIDWNLNAGVGYGFTRYGVWYDQEHNVVQGANSSGFDAMVVGEYQSLVPDADAAYGQLAYMRDHGVQFIHAMCWPKEYDDGFNASLRAALERLIGEDRPRPGQTGGTGQVRAVRQGERVYDVVSLGTGAGNTGLIKSVNADGTFEGSVYVVPFHAHVAIETLTEQARSALAATPMSFGPFPGIDAGNVLDFAFDARGGAGSLVTFRVYHHGVELKDLRTAIRLTGDWQSCRFQARVRIDTDDLRIDMGTGDPDAGAWRRQRVELRDFVATRHSERTTKLKKGVFAGERHEGGVTFDLLDSP